MGGITKWLSVITWLGSGNETHALMIRFHQSRRRKGLWWSGWSAFTTHSPCTYFVYVYNCHSPFQKDLFLFFFFFWKKKKEKDCNYGTYLGPFLVECTWGYLYASPSHGLHFPPDLFIKKIIIIKLTSKKITNLHII